MNFNDMHAFAKKIDAQITLLETKVSHPMNMMYSNNSNHGVKVLAMLKRMIEDVKNKKMEIEQMIEEENTSWSVMVEDYNSVSKFKNEIVSNLNEYENLWSSHYHDYKPFISYKHGDSSMSEELDSLSGLNVHDNRQIADQSLNDSINNITLS